MPRPGLVLSLALTTCASHSPTPDPKPAPAPTLAPAPTSAPEPPSAPAARPSSIQHLADGSCEPTPRPNDPCDEHGYCVLSWGEPGGHSSALWCRDGRWRIEEEVNLE